MWRGGRAPPILKSAASARCRGEEVEMVVSRPVRPGLAALVVVSLILVFPAESSAATNLALNRPATASSTWSATYDPPKAVDSNDTTRWSAASGQWTNQWVRIDLG